MSLFYKFWNDDCLVLRNYPHRWLRSSPLYGIAPSTGNSQASQVIISGNGCPSLPSPSHICVDPVYTAGYHGFQHFYFPGGIPPISLFSTHLLLSLIGLCHQSYVIPVTLLVLGIGLYLDFYVLHLYLFFQISPIESCGYPPLLTLWSLYCSEAAVWSRAFFYIMN